MIVVLDFYNMSICAFHILLLLYKKQRLKTSTNCTTGLESAFSNTAAISDIQPAIVHLQKSTTKKFSIRPHSMIRFQGWKFM